MMFYCSLCFLFVMYINETACSRFVFVMLGALLTVPGHLLTSPGTLVTKLGTFTAIPQCPLYDGCRAIRRPRTSLPRLPSITLNAVLCYAIDERAARFVFGMSAPGATRYTHDSMASVSNSMGTVYESMSLVSSTMR